MPVNKFLSGDPGVIYLNALKLQTGKLPPYYPGIALAY